MTANPVLVHLSRGALIESAHRGAVAVARADGRSVFAVGDVGRPVYPRSAIKPLQAIALVESGAAETHGVSDTELALACASHNGESFHLSAVLAWLARLDLPEARLACGCAVPLGEAALAEHHRAGRDARRALHNCSGKHTGLLTLCRHLDVPVEGYHQHEHPVSRHWLRVLGEMAALDGEALPWAPDGCGLPAPAMPLHALATALARMADPAALSPARQRACERVIHACTGHPAAVAGTQRCCSAVMAQLGGRALVKVGAEGVYAAVLPGLGLGVALKIDDGARRGAEVALGAVLDRLGVLDEADRAALAPWFSPVSRNSRDEPVGKLEAGDAWAE